VYIDPRRFNLADARAGTARDSKLSPTGRQPYATHLSSPPCGSPRQTGRPRRRRSKPSPARPPSKPAVHRRPGQTGSPGSHAATVRPSH